MPPIVPDISGEFIGKKLGERVRVRGKRGRVESPSGATSDWHADRRRCTSVAPGPLPPTVADSRGIKW